MEDLGKKILIFIVLMILLIALSNVLFRFVLPLKAVRLISDNMAPTYDKGDVLFYSQTNEYVVEDVIISETSRGTIVTRIIEINDDGTFKAKGDGNAASIVSSLVDETHIQKEQIIGKILFGTKWFIFYPILYIIQIIIALILTKLIYSKKIDKIK